VSARNAKRSLGDGVNAALWRFLFGAIGRAIPFGLCRVMARPLGYLAWGLGLRRAVALQNLALAFPDRSERDRRRIARGSLVNLFTVYLEILTLRYISDRHLAGILSVENIELLETIGPEGAILLSGHFGNWELLAFGSAALSGVPFSIIVKEQRDYGELERTRTVRGNRLIPTARAAREAASLLGRGGVVAMLADQSATDRDALVEMFGIPTYSYDAPARLALRFRPRVIAGFAERSSDGRYHVRLTEIPHADLPDTPDGARDLIARYVALLESAVRRHPEQWVWQHRKWKNSPGVEYREG
jgi:KDO2-lipid IV(A) lauroyltransferase